MEQNISDLLKDAFSEVDTDFGDLEFDEATNPSQTQPSADTEFDLKDANQHWETSEQGSFETFTKVYEPEENKAPDPNSSMNDYMPYEFVGNTGKATTLGEENNGNYLSQKETIKLAHESIKDNGIQGKEHQELSSSLAFIENQTPEESSSGSEDEDINKNEEKEEEEERLGTYDTKESKEQTPQYDANRSGSSTCPDQGRNYEEDQVAEKATSKTSAEQLENQLCAEFLIEKEFGMHNNEETNDSMPLEFGVCDASILGHLNQEETIKPSRESVDNQGLQSEKYQEIPSPTVSDENRTQEERSSGSEDDDNEEEEEEEESLDNYNTAEPTKQILQCDPVTTTDKTLTSIKPTTPPVGYSEEGDLKEFTEEDQEGIKESLAEYPSDLFQIEGEEHTKCGKVQPSSLVDSSLGDDCSTNEKTSVEDNLLKEDNGSTNLTDLTDFTIIDSNHEIKTKELEEQTISEQIESDLSTSFQKGMVHTDDLQDSQTNYSSTKEEDSSNPSNDQQDYDSDHSTSHKETFPSVRHEEEWKSKEQCNTFSEDLGKSEHDDDYTGIDPQDRDVSNASLVISNRDLCSTLDSVQLEKVVQQFIKAEDQLPSELKLNCSRNTNTFIPDGLLSSAVFMSEDNLPIDDYDWSLTVDEPTEFILDEAEDQEYTKGMEELDFEEYMEGMEQNERDWEQEKPRIEAFYRFYNDQVDTEDQSERNHKVTFCLDHESSESEDQVDTEDKSEAEEHCSDLWNMPVDPPALNVELISQVAYSQDHESSEYEEDSESSEQELDNLPDTPVVAVKPEFHSESDDEPQEKPFHPEKPKVQPKKQLHIDPAQKACPGKSKRFTVLKSVLALGLMTVIGVVSFWWATDNLDWIN